MAKLGRPEAELRRCQYRQRCSPGLQYQGNDYRLVAAIDYRRQILFI
jgi:mRNA-degrading endonuclease HigB of HigAB toxin-antitoxin module